MLYKTPLFLSDGNIKKVNVGSVSDVTITVPSLALLTSANFTPALNNPRSPKFKELEQDFCSKVSSAVNCVYSIKVNGRIFKRTWSGRSWFHQGLWIYLLVCGFKRLGSNAGKSRGCHASRKARKQWIHPGFPGQKSKNRIDVHQPKFNAKICNAVV